jgi:hypothetical protein
LISDTDRHLPFLRARGVLLAVCAAGMLVACQNDGRDVTDDPPPIAPSGIERVEDRPYYEGPPGMAARIEDLLTQSITADEKERLGLGRRIIAHGEPALPVLLRGLEGPEPERRRFSAYLLGLTRDPRPLRELDALRGDPDEELRFEAATAMIRIGDRRGFTTLIDGLGHGDPLLRRRSIGMLRAATGETFGYRHDDHADERRAAVARWRAWASRQPAPRGP